MMKAILTKKIEMLQYEWAGHAGLSRKIHVGEEMRPEGGYWMVLRNYSVFLLVMSSTSHQNVNFTQVRTCLPCSVSYTQHLEPSEVLHTYGMNEWMNEKPASWMHELLFFFRVTVLWEIFLTLPGILDSLLWVFMALWIIALQLILLKLFAYISIFPKRL